MWKGTKDMNNYDKLKKMLEAKEIDYVENINTVNKKDKFINLTIDVAGGEELKIYFIFNEDFHSLSIYIYDIGKIEEREKRNALLELVNRENANRYFGILSVEEDGKVTCQHTVILNDSESCFEDVFNVFVEMVDSLADGDFFVRFRELKNA